MERKKIGILINENDYVGEKVSALVSEITSRLNCCDVEIIIVPERPKAEGRFNMRLKSKVLGRIHAIEKKLCTVRKYKKTKYRATLDELSQKYGAVHAQYIQKGRALFIWIEDTVSLKREYCVIVNTLEEIITGPILTAADRGVISIHHGDPAFFRGRPAGFWEIMNNETYTHSIVQRLTDRLDGGQILSRWVFPTKPPWYRNLYMLKEKAPVQLANVAVAIAKNEPDRPEENKCGTIRRLPSYGAMFVYVWKYWATRSAKKFLCRSILKRTGSWHLEVAHITGETIVQDRLIKVRAAERGKSIADPFLVQFDNRKVLYCEEFSRCQKGRIVAYEETTRGWEYLGIALEEEFHISFPCVIEIEQRLFMVPETSADRTIRLYECTAFPLGWQLKKVLFDNVDAAENYIFWWHTDLVLFSNICSVDAGDHDSALFGFIAPNGDFSRMRQLNNGLAICNDARVARNAGGGVRDGTVYRATQRREFDSYGCGLLAHEVLEVTEDGVRQTCSRNEALLAIMSKRNTHHISILGDTVAFDVYS